MNEFWPTKLGSNCNIDELGVEIEEILMFSVGNDSEFPDTIVCLGEKP